MTTQKILLSDSREVLMRQIRALAGKCDLNEIFAAWMLRGDLGLSVDGPLEAALGRPVSQKHYRDAAILGYAAAAQTIRFQHFAELESQLAWLAGRELSLGGAPAGFMTDAPCLLGAALGARQTGNQDAIAAVRSWLEKFAEEFLGSNRAKRWEKELVVAALRLVNSSILARLPIDESTADVRLALRKQCLLPPCNPEMVAEDEAAVLRLMLDTQCNLSDFQAVLRLYAFEETRAAAAAASMGNLFMFPKTIPSLAADTRSLSTMSDVQPHVKVFISYAQENSAGSSDHNEKVIALAHKLRQHGIETMIDAYLNVSPPQGWPLWMQHQIEWADYVIVICTEAYRKRCERRESPGRGKGATWEGAIITQTIYEENSNNDKFIPVLLDDKDHSHIPFMLQSATHYNVAKPEGFEKLYRRLTNQPLISVPPIGPKVALPPRDVKPL